MLKYEWYVKKEKANNKKLLKIKKLEWWKHNSRETVTDKVSVIKQVKNNGNNWIKLRAIKV